MNVCKKHALISDKMAIKAKKVLRTTSIYVRHLVRALKILSFLFLFSFLYFGVFSEYRLALRNEVVTRAAKLGFNLQTLVIEGRCNTDEAEACSFLEFARHTPIWNVNLDRVWQKASKGVWIKRCSVSRKLPNVICISLLERVPIAIWQCNYKHHLIDEEGEIIDVGPRVADFAYLPKVVGKGANLYAKHLLEEIGHDPDLASRVEVAIRCGERRWDLRLGDIVVKLPQEGAKSAWKTLSELHAKQSIFSSKLKTIDLRNKEKLYLEYQN